MRRLARSLGGRRSRSGRAYVLCAMPRSGSNLLCDLLASSGVAGTPHEYLQAVWRAEYRRRGDPADGATYLGALARTTSTENRVFGLKAMWEEFGALLAELRLEDPGSPNDRARLERSLGPTAFVFLDREDTVSQAVSWSIARQTGQWHSNARRKGEPVFDPESIAALETHLAGGRLAWAAWFERERLDPLRITYENLVADPEAVGGRVLRHLGLGAAAGRPLTSTLSRQATQLNEEWAARYRVWAARRP